MKDWEISVWGVRGSTPVPSKKFMEYGGNTSCFSVKREDHVIIFDMGTGLTVLGRELIKQKIMRFDILLSHLHIAQLHPLLLSHQSDALFLHSRCIPPLAIDLSTVVNL